MKKMKFSDKTSFSHPINIMGFISQKAGLLKYSLGGAFLGLTWGSGLRAWMALLALEFGDRPHFNWLNTFLVILVSSSVMGGIWGVAEYTRQIAARTTRRWAVLAPLCLVISPLLFMKNFIPIFLSTGEGGGAISVALTGLFGGYALAGQGKGWLRVLSGSLFVILVLGTVFALHMTDIFDGNIPSASQTFGALFYTLLMVSLAFGASIPFRLKIHPSR